MDIHAFFVSDHIATDIPPHSHNFFQLIYCKGGCGSITIRDAVYSARPGTVYLAAPGVVHAIKNNADLSLLECKFSIAGQFSKLLLSLPDTFRISNDSTAVSLLESVVKEGFAKGAHYNHAADANLLLFFIHALRMVAHEPELSSPSITYAHLDIKANPNDDCEVMMLNLLPFLEEHLADKITLEMLANRVHFNKTYFIRRFKALWGCAPMQYVNQLRLQHAARQLFSTDDPISAIAQRCGFASAHYFSRKFHEEFGLSPLAYRTSQKNIYQP